MNDKKPQAIMVSLDLTGADYEVSTLHTDIREAVAYVDQQVGSVLRKGSGASFSIRRALEGTPLVHPVTVQHEKGYVTYYPISGAKGSL